jgi:hypothetical protein
MIWIAAAVALVVCISATVVGPGDPAGLAIEGKDPLIKKRTEIVPIPGGPGSEGYMSSSDDAVERARKKRGPSSSPAAPNAQTGLGPEK